MWVGRDDVISSFSIENAELEMRISWGISKISRVIVAVPLKRVGRDDVISSFSTENAELEMKITWEILKIS